MAETGSWNGHVFTVLPNLIRGFTGLTIKGASETNTKTSSKQQYLERKAGKPVEVALTVELNAMTGCNVRSEAIAFVNDARDGTKNYFYVNSKKLVPCQLMLTDASVEETQIAPNGTWVSARVKLSMKQASKYDGSASSSSSSSGKKKTAKKTSVKNSTSVTITAAVGAAIGAASSTAKATTSTNKAQTTINQLVSAAKSASKSKTVAKSSGGGGTNYLTTR